MKVLLVGGGGFIGKSFLEQYGNDLDIVVMDRKDPEVENVRYHFIDVDVTDYQALKNNYSNIDCVVFLVYNRVQLYDNIIAVRNIARMILTCKVKKLIHFSTISVYNPFHSGPLDENVSYSKINDPYSTIKRYQEWYLQQKFKNYPDTEVMILQPTIIIGAGGYWSNHLAMVSKESEFQLPSKGRSYCNTISTFELNSILFSLIVKKNERQQFEKYIVSGMQPIKWSELYQRHNNSPNKIQIKQTVSSNRYHDNPIMNILFHLLFTKVGFLVVLVINKFIWVNKERESQEKSPVIFTPTGISRIVHNSQYYCDIKKLKQKLYNAR